MSRVVYRLIFLLLLAVLTGFPCRSFAQIAPGVTQSAAHTANISGTVLQGDGAPVADADVTLRGPSILTTKSDTHGNFAFTNVPWGTYEILATSSSGTALRNNVLVNRDVSIAIQYKPRGEVKEIARVSTSGVGAHINVSSSSIESVNPSSYAFSGNGTWKDLFSQIPGVAVSGYTGGGLSAGSVVGSPQAPVILSVNGALPYETSTSLDGMQLQGVSNAEYIEGTGGGLDLSNMPINAFETADVVRGPGANAPSIVDSIGGTFVLHGPGEVTKNQFEFAVSNDAYGGVVSNAKVAVHFGRLSATFIYGINDSPGPLGARAMMGSLSSTPATIDGQTVWAPVGGESLSGQGVTYCFCSASASLLYCCAPQSTAWKDQSGAAALSYKVTPSITATVFYAGGTSRTTSQSGYWPTEFSPAAPPYTGSLAPSPAGQTNYTLLGISAGSSTPLTQANSLLEEKVTAFIGHGVLRLAALQHNSFDSESTPSFCFPNGTYTLWGTTNVGATYPGATTAFNGTVANLTFNAIGVDEHLWSNNRDLFASYALQLGAYSSLGISYVTSSYNDPYAIDETFSGVPIYSANLPPAAFERTNETRIHFDTTISENLFLGLSWYSARGTYHVPVPSNPAYWTDSAFPYSAPRLGVVWRANRDTAFRVSAGGGYALPALYNLTGYALQLIGSEYYENTANLSLRPETSFGFDLGTDMRFHQNTVLSLDLYRENLYGQFYQGDTFGTYNGLLLSVTQLENLATSRYEGINLNIRHDVPSGYYWDGTLGLTRGYVVSVPPGFYNNDSCPNTACTNQGVVPGANFNSACFGATVPYTSASARLGYRWKSGTYVDLSPTYYGNNNIYYTPKAFVELDAHAGIELTRNLSLLATFHNVTGVYDQSIQIHQPTIVTPVVAGATGLYQGAAQLVPYGPQTLIVTADFKY